MTTEADTCRKFIVPKLQAVGWDDDPHSIAEQRSFTDGRIVVRGNKKTEVVKPEEPGMADPVAREEPPAIVDWIPEETRKYYFGDGRVEIAAHLVYELDADGKQLRVVDPIDYTAEKVRPLCPTRDQFRNCWQNAEQRSEIIQQLAECGIDFQTVALHAGKPDADPFDLLCHLACNAPLLTRRQRVERLKKQEAAFFNRFGPEAREILTLVLEKYANDGELQFTLPDVLKVPPISDLGNVNEIINKFGGPDKLRTAVNRLQSLLYAM